MGDCALVINGGRTGNNKALRKHWMGDMDCDEEFDAGALPDEETDNPEPPVALAKYSVAEVTLFASEASLRQRRRLTRGTASLKQTESMFVMTPGPLQLPERSGKFFEGTNKGTLIGPITLPDPEKEWQATVKEKRGIYGKRFRIAVGGKSPEGPVQKRQDSEVEPVFHWSYPVVFYEELLHRFFARQVFDMTPGPGAFGEAALKHRVGYFCVAMTEAHASALEARFKNCAIKYMCEEGCPLYDAKCAAAFANEQKSASDMTAAKATTKKRPPPEATETPQKSKDAIKRVKSAKKAKKDDPDTEGSAEEEDNDDDSEWDASGDDG